jgi:hypothetical protein
VLNCSYFVSYLNVLILACPKLPGVKDADVHLGKLDASMIKGFRQSRR